MTEKNQLSKETFTELQAKVKEYLSKYEKLRGFL